MEYHARFVAQIVITSLKLSFAKPRNSATEYLLDIHKSIELAKYPTAATIKCMDFDSLVVITLDSIRGRAAFLECLRSH